MKLGEAAFRRTIGIEKLDKCSLAQASGTEHAGADSGTFAQRTCHSLFREPFDVSTRGSRPIVFEQNVADAQAFPIESPQGQSASYDVPTVLAVVDVNAVSRLNKIEHFAFDQGHFADIGRAVIAGSRGVAVTSEAGTSDRLDFGNPCHGVTCACRDEDGFDVRRAHFWNGA